MKKRDQRKKNKPPRPKHLRRKVHFPNGEVWTWRFGWNVLIREPDGLTTHRVPLTALTGWTVADLERSAYKGYGPGIGPGLVKEYVEKHLRRKGEAA